MRGKFMPTAVMLLLAWNSNCFAVNTGHSVISSASGYDVKSVLPLPSVTNRSWLRIRKPTTGFIAYYSSSAVNGMLWTGTRVSVFI